MKSFSKAEECPFCHGVSICRKLRISDDAEPYACYSDQNGRTEGAYVHTSPDAFTEYLRVQPAFIAAEQALKVARAEDTDTQAMWMDTLGALATANLRNGDDSFVRNRRVQKAEEEFERATRRRDHVHAAAVEALSQYVRVTRFARAELEDAKAAFDDAERTARDSAFVSPRMIMMG